jgi:mono/diheme cytochrome c family protein
VASDPDRDLISIVDLPSHQVTGQIQLPVGAEPGRLVQDGSGQVHAILRRGGGIADVDLYARSLLGLRQTCALPRGIAYRASDSTLLVTCLTGDVITMDTNATQKEPLGTVTVHDANGPITDLRDVLVIGTSTFVTTFRSASVLPLAADGSVIGAAITPSIRPDPSAAELTANGLSGGTPQNYDPAVAWRAVVGPAGDIIVAHEGGTDRVINVAAGTDGATQVPVSTSCTSSEYGGETCTTTSGAPICTPPILIGEVSSISPTTGDVFDGPALPNGALPVDIVATPDKQSYVIALAGNPSGTVAADGSPLLNVLRVPAVNAASTPAAAAATFDGDLCGLAFAQSGITVPGQVIAVALDASGQTVAQTRDPATLQYVTSSGIVAIALSSSSVANDGFSLFHTNTGRGMTCAGCHAEGGDDGRTWKFTDGFDANGAPVEVKPRRTQTFRSGFLGTAPFHWDAEFPGLPALMTDVFLHRMSSSTVPTPAQEGDLENWMDGIPPKMHDAPSTELAASIAAGKALFEDGTVGCTTCHSGANFTDNENKDIGFGYALQTPTLIDVAFRAPYLHDGSVPTLLARFSDPTAKSGKHGTTAQLSAEQINDLVAYLGSL